MSYRFCLECYLPVFRIISDLAPEYCCLNADCGSFKASVSESATAADLFDDTGGETDSLSFPLEQDFLPLFPDQNWETQPLPQELTEQASWPVPQSTPPLEQLTQQGPSMQQAAPGLTLNGVELVRPAILTAQIRKKQRLLVFPILEKPFSELPVVEGPDHIAEITEFVNRSVEQRQKEAEETGRRKADHTSWLLYIRAYNTLAKTVLGCYNDTRGKFDFTTVTSFLSQSWAIETTSVRAKFNTLAEINRLIHRQAFPTAWGCKSIPAQKNEAPE